MVWLLPSARSARVLTILLVTYTVGVSKLTHVIASSAEAAFAVMSHAASIGDYFGVFLLPTLIGNMIGGISMVAIVNHAAIAPGFTSRGAGVDRRAAAGSLGSNRAPSRAIHGLVR